MSRHNLTKSLPYCYLIGQLMYRYTVALRVISYLLELTYLNRSNGEGLRI